MSDLFSNIEHKEPEKYINEVVKENNLKNQIEVNALTNSAINRLRETGKEITQTESGLIIKY
jgi:hypothetical protein